MIDEILAGIEIVGKIFDHLTAAKAQAQSGLPITPEQRAAVQAANDLRVANLTAEIDARIGPAKPTPTLTPFSDVQIVAASEPERLPPASGGA